MGLFDRSKPTKKIIHEEVVKEDTSISEEQIPKRLPVLPLKGVVLYPSTVVPIFVDNKVAMQVVKTASEKERKIVGVFTLKPKLSKVTPRNLYPIGTAALIHKTIQVSPNGFMVVVQGIAKVESLEFTLAPNLTATIRVIREAVKINKNVEALSKSVLSSAQKLIASTPYLPQELQMALEGLDDPLRLVYQVTSLIRLKVEEKQKILELPGVERKLKQIGAILTRELELLELGGKIQKNVRREFDRFGREAFLRQQLKQIKKELGEISEGEKESVNYRKKLKKVKLPEEVKKECEREINRLEDMHPWAGDYQVIRTYLDWVLDLPWSIETKDRLDLSGAKRQLSRDHYGLKEPKERIVEYLAVRKLKQSLRGPILCFVGPPGVGKTSLGQSIAKALDRKFVRMSLGGMRDEAEIRGHRRTYIGSLPGRIIQGIRRAGSRNPVFMLDEIDKVGTDFRGDPASALLEVLDPEQNRAFRDHYLDLDFDLSSVFFIATANVLDPIQPALLDRVEVIRLPGYTQEEKIKIAEKFLLPKQLKEHGLRKDQLLIPEEVMRKVISEYTQEAGVRNLEREIAKVCRKVAQVITETRKRKVKLTLKNLVIFLGRQKVYPETDFRVGRPGVAAGLAVSPSGGVVQFVEASKMPGKKGFTLTGQMGDVMKESARAALSLVRSRAKKLKVNERFFDKIDLHLHVPAGAVPKDGPSAGIAMTAALASLLTNVVVRKDVAMTGEISLSGLVLPIGGVKEKVLAAKRVGMKTVILPKRNENDVLEIDDGLKKGLKFIFVENIDQVLQNSLGRRTVKV